MVGNLVTNLKKKFLLQSSPADQSPLHAAVQEVLTDVQSYARSHGGNIRLVEVTSEGDVKIKLSGACSGCPLSSITIKHGVENQLRQQVPQIRNIIVLN